MSSFENVNIRAICEHIHFLSSGCSYKHSRYVEQLKILEKELLGLFLYNLQLCHRQCNILCIIQDVDKYILFREIYKSENVIINLIRDSTMATVHSAFTSESVDLIIYEMDAERDQEYLFQVQSSCMRLLKRGGLFICENLKANITDSKRFVNIFAALSDFMLHTKFFEQQYLTNIVQPGGECLAICKKLSSLQTLPWDRVPFYTSPTTPFVLVHITSSMRCTGDKSFSLFEESSRQRQLIFTIRSVVRKIQNPFIVLTETHDLSDEMKEILQQEGVREIRSFPETRQLFKSVSEAVFIDSVLREFIKPDCLFESYCKLSGRYYILDHFTGISMNHIVCKKNSEDVVQTRFFSIPKKYFENFKESVENVRNDPRLGESHDIEHLLTERFSGFLEAPNYETIGVGGFLAGTCQVVYD